MLCGMDLAKKLLDLTLEYQEARNGTPERDMNVIAAEYGETLKQFLA